MCGGTILASWYIRQYILVSLGPYMFKRLLRCVCVCHDVARVAAMQSLCLCVQLICVSDVVEAHVGSSAGAH